MDLDIEMGESAEAVHDIPVDQLPEADDILVRFLFGASLYMVCRH